MKVVNLRHEEYTIYIGRGSVFGNPFIINKYISRNKSIRLYKNHAKSSPALLDAISKLPGDAVLGCFCKPLPCHGDVIIKLRKELNDATKKCDSYNKKV